MKWENKRHLINSNLYLLELFAYDPGSGDNFTKFLWRITWLAWGEFLITSSEWGVCGESLRCWDENKKHKLWKQLKFSLFYFQNQCISLVFIRVLPTFTVMLHRCHHVSRMNDIVCSSATCKVKISRVILLCFIIRCYLTWFYNLYGSS